MPSRQECIDLVSTTVCVSEFDFEGLLENSPVRIRKLVSNIVINRFY